MTDDKHTADTSEQQGIARGAQDISTDDLVANDYNAPDISSDHRSADDGGGRTGHHEAPAALSDPGQTWHDDSIHASSNDEQRRARRPDDDHDYSAGPEMTAATGVGKPDDPHYDEDLHRLNDGRHQSDGNLSHRQSEWDKERIAQAICSDLPISKRQRETVVLAMKRLDLDRFGHQKAIERVCLGVVAVIVNDERQEQAADPTDVTPITWEDAFKDLAEKYDVGMSDLTTIKDVVREQLGDRPPVPGNAGIKRDENLPKTSVSDRPDEFWEAHHPAYWARVAQTWDRQDDELKAAIPDEKRELVDRLRKWEPWEQDDESAAEEDASPTKPATTESDDEHDPGATSEDNLDADLESLEEAVEEEAEALLERMNPDADHDVDADTAEDDA